MAAPDKTIDPRILQCAREEFLSKPYEAVSLREICAKAGVTTGALYNRYPNTYIIKEKNDIIQYIRSGLKYEICNTESNLCEHKSPRARRDW